MNKIFSIIKGLSKGKLLVLGVGAMVVIGGTIYGIRNLSNEVPKEKENSTMIAKEDTNKKEKKETKKDTKEVTKVEEEPLSEVSAEEEQQGGVNQKVQENQPTVNNTSTTENNTNNGTTNNNTNNSTSNNNQNNNAGNNGGSNTTPSNPVPSTPIPEPTPEPSNPLPTVVYEYDANLSRQLEAKIKAYRTANGRSEITISSSLQAQAKANAEKGIYSPGYSPGGSTWTYFTNVDRTADAIFNRGLQGQGILKNLIMGGGITLEDGTFIDGKASVGVGVYKRYGDDNPSSFDLYTSISFNYE